MAAAGGGGSGAASGLGSSPPSEGAPAVGAARRAERPKWLESWYDPMAGLVVRDTCATSADIRGDNDWRLLAACKDRKMRVIVGSRQVVEREVALLENPTAVASFFSDEREPRLPAIAVAGGSHVFIYRNLRPFFKFKLPLLPVDEREQGAWSSAIAGDLPPLELRTTLARLRDDGVDLTLVSAELLAKDEGASETDLREFIASHRPEVSPLIRSTVITCMTTINKNMAGDHAVAHLVIGTENREVFVLSPDGSTILLQERLPSVPTHIAVEGLYDIDSRILIACRNAKIYAIKNRKLSSTIIELESQITHFCVLNQMCYIATMDNTLWAIQAKGRREWSIALPARLTALAPMVVTDVHTVSAIVLALADGDIRVYIGKALAMQTGPAPPGSTPDVVNFLRFGVLGRESRCLVAIHASGALRVRILPRRALLDSAMPSGPPEEQDIPLPVPKKTTLYVEQAQRERDEAVAMHRIFQKDLCRLRLEAARSFVRCIADGRGPTTTVAGANLRVSADVAGLGPLFRLRISLTNTGARPATDLLLAFAWNPAQYAVMDPLRAVPLLLQQHTFDFDVFVRCVDPTGAAGGKIRALLVNASSSIPVVSVVIDMPVSLTDAEAGFV